MDFISRRDAERQRAQRVLGSCDFARGIAVEMCDWGFSRVERVERVEGIGGGIGRVEV